MVKWFDGSEEVEKSWNKFLFFLDKMNEAFIFVQFMKLICHRNHWIDDTKKSVTIMSKFLWPTANTLNNYFFPTKDFLLKFYFYFPKMYPLKISLLIYIHLYNRFRIVPRIFVERIMLETKKYPLTYGLTYNCSLKILVELICTPICGVCARLISQKFR